MSISSSTPEAQPDRCPVCGQEIPLEASEPPGDRPCPNCGCVNWRAVDRPGSPPLLHIQLGSRVMTHELCGVLHKWAEAHPGARIVLDFENVAYMASEAVAHLVKLYTGLKHDHATMTITNLHPDLMEIFRITRLDRVFGLG